MSLNQPPTHRPTSTDNRPKQIDWAEIRKNLSEMFQEIIESDYPEITISSLFKEVGATSDRDKFELLALLGESTESSALKLYLQLQRKLINTDFNAFVLLRTILLAAGNLIGHDNDFRSATTSGLLNREIDQEGSNENYRILAWVIENMPAAEIQSLARRSGALDGKITEAKRAIAEEDLRKVTGGGDDLLTALAEVPPPPGGNEGSDRDRQLSLLIELLTDEINDIDAQQDQHQIIVTASELLSRFLNDNRALLNDYAPAADALKRIAKKVNSRWVKIYLAFFVGLLDKRHNFGTEEGNRFDQRLGAIMAVLGISFSEIALGQVPQDKFDNLLKTIQATADQQDWGDETAAAQRLTGLLTIKPLSSSSEKNSETPIDALKEKIREANGQTDEFEKIAVALHFYSVDAGIGEESLAALFNEVLPLIENLSIRLLVAITVKTMVFGWDNGIEANLIDGVVKSAVTEMYNFRPNSEHTNVTTIPAFRVLMPTIIKTLIELDNLVDLKNKQLWINRLNGIQGPIEASPSSLNGSGETVEEEDEDLASIAELSDEKLSPEILDQIRTAAADKKGEVKDAIKIINGNKLDQLQAIEVVNQFMLLVPTKQWEVLAGLVLLKQRIGDSFMVGQLKAMKDKELEAEVKQMADLTIHLSDKEKKVGRDVKERILAAQHQIYKIVHKDNNEFKKLMRQKLGEAIKQHSQNSDLSISNVVTIFADLLEAKWRELTGKPAAEVQEAALSSLLEADITNDADPAPTSEPTTAVVSPDRAGAPSEQAIDDYVTAVEQNAYQFNFPGEVNTLRMLCGGDNIVLKEIWRTADKIINKLSKPEQKITVAVILRMIELNQGAITDAATNMKAESAIANFIAIYDEFTGTTYQADPVNVMRWLMELIEWDSLDVLMDRSAVRGSVEQSLLSAGNLQTTTAPNNVPKPLIQRRGRFTFAELVQNNPELENRVNDLIAFINSGTADVMGLIDRVDGFFELIDDLSFDDMWQIALATLEKTTDPREKVLLAIVYKCTELLSLRDRWNEIINVLRVFNRLQHKLVNGGLDLQQINIPLLNIIQSKDLDILKDSAQVEQLLLNEIGYKMVISPGNPVTYVPIQTTATSPQVPVQLTSPQVTVRPVVPLQQVPTVRLGNAIPLLSQTNQVTPADINTIAGVLTPRLRRMLNRTNVLGNTAYQNVRQALANASITIGSPESWDVAQQIIDSITDIEDQIAAAIVLNVINNQVTQPLNEANDIQNVVTQITRDLVTAGNDLLEVQKAILDVLSGRNTPVPDLKDKTELQNLVLINIGINTPAAPAIQPQQSGAAGGNPTQTATTINPGLGAPAAQPPNAAANPNPILPGAQQPATLAPSGGLPGGTPAAQNLNVPPNLNTGIPAQAPAPVLPLVQGGVNPNIQPPINQAPIPLAAQQPVIPQAPAGGPGGVQNLNVPQQPVAQPPAAPVPQPAAPVAPLVQPPIPLAQAAVNNYPQQVFGQILTRVNNVSFNDIDATKAAEIVNKALKGTNKAELYSAWQLALSGLIDKIKQILLYSQDQKEIKAGNLKLIELYKLQALINSIGDSAELVAINKEIIDRLAKNKSIKKLIPDFGVPTILANNPNLTGPAADLIQIYNVLQAPDLVQSFGNMGIVLTAMEARGLAAYLRINPNNASNSDIERLLAAYNLIAEHIGTTSSELQAQMAASGDSLAKVILENIITIMRQPTVNNGPAILAPIPVVAGLQVGAAAQPFINPNLGPVQPVTPAQQPVVAAGANLPPQAPAQTLAPQNVLNARQAFRPTTNDVLDLVVGPQRAPEMMAILDPIIQMLTGAMYQPAADQKLLLANMIPLLAANPPQGLGNALAQLLTANWNSGAIDFRLDGYVQMFGQNNIPGNVLHAFIAYLAEEIAQAIADLNAVGTPITVPAILTQLAQQWIVPQVTLNPAANQIAPIVAAAQAAAPGAQPPVGGAGQPPMPPVPPVQPAPPAGRQPPQPPVLPAGRQPNPPLAPGVGIGFQPANMGRWERFVNGRRDYREALRNDHRWYMRRLVDLENVAGATIAIGVGALIAHGLSDGTATVIENLFRGLIDGADTLPIVKTIGQLVTKMNQSGIVLKDAVGASVILFALGPVAKLGSMVINGITAPAPGQDSLATQRAERTQENRLLNLLRRKIHELDAGNIVFNIDPVVSDNEYRTVLSALGNNTTVRELQAQLTRLRNERIQNQANPPIDYDRIIAELSDISRRIADMGLIVSTNVSAGAAAINGSPYARWFGPIGNLRKLLGRA